MVFASAHRESPRFSSAGVRLSLAGAPKFLNNLFCGATLDDVDNDDEGKKILLGYLAKVVTMKLSPEK
jgi:hypothetical protein